MYGTIAVKLIIGMTGVLLFLRISGKAQMAQITPLDTVSAFVIGALVGGVIYNPDMDAWHLIFALAIWTFFNMLIRHSLRFKLMRKIIKGDSIYVVKKGILNLKAFKRNGLEMEQFRTLLREKGIFSMYDVDDVRFETNGELTVSVQGRTSESYLFVNNGSINRSSLRNANRTEEWLHQKLEILGFEKPKELFCVEWTPGKGFYIVSRDGKINSQSITEEFIEDELTS